MTLLFRLVRTLWWAIQADHLSCMRLPAPPELMRSCKPRSDPLESAPLATPFANVEDSAPSSRHSLLQASPTAHRRREVPTRSPTRA